MYKNIQLDTWSCEVLWNLYESLKYTVDCFWCNQWTNDKPILITCVLYDIVVFNPKKAWGSIWPPHPPFHPPPLPHPHFLELFCNFPENFIEIPLVVQKIWRFSVSINYFLITKKLMKSALSGLIFLVHKDSHLEVFLTTVYVLKISRFSKKKSYWQSPFVIKVKEFF